nr:replication protein, Rep3 family [Psychrobacter sp.]
MSSKVETFEVKYPENWVVMQNKIMQTFHQMTLDEKRLLILASPVARLIDATEKDAIEITAEKFANACGIKVNSAYSQLEEASKTLMQRSFSYKNDRGKRVRVTWVIRSVYEDGFISVCFPDEVLLMLKVLNADNPYTKYKQDSVLKLKGEYSIDLYHIAKKFEGMKRFSISLDEIKQEFSLPPSYDHISNLKARMIKPAIKEINEKTDINITYENIKRGRTVTGLKFTVKPKANIKKGLEEKRDPYTADMFTIDGLNDKQLGRIVRNPNFVAEYNHLVSPTSPAGQSQQGWDLEMVKRLKEDASQFGKRPIKDYLEY